MRASNLVAATVLTNKTKTGASPSSEPPYFKLALSHRRLTTRTHSTPLHSTNSTPYRTYRHWKLEHRLETVAPKWSIEPNDTSIVRGRAASVDCMASGFPPPRVIWTKASGEFPQSVVAVGSSSSSTTAAAANHPGGGKQQQTDSQLLLSQHGLGPAASGSSSSSSSHHPGAWVSTVMLVSSLLRAPSS